MDIRKHFSVLALSLTFCGITGVAAACEQGTQDVLAQMKVSQAPVEMKREARGVKHWQTVQRHQTLCAGDVVRVGRGGVAHLIFSNQRVLELTEGKVVSLRQSADKARSRPQGLWQRLRLWMSAKAPRLAPMEDFVNAGVTRLGRASPTQVSSASMALPVISPSETESASDTASTSPSERASAPIGTWFLADLEFPPSSRSPIGLGDQPRTAHFSQRFSWIWHLLGEEKYQQVYYALQNIPPRARDMEFHQLQVHWLLKQARLRSALSYIEQLALDQSPQAQHLLQRAIRIALELEAYEQATHWAQRQAELLDYVPHAHVLLSRLYMQTNRVQAALESAEQAVSLSAGRDAVALAQLASVLLVKGDLPAALQRAQLAAERQSQPFSLSVLGLVQLALNNTSEALAGFKAAEALDPDYALSQQGLSLLDASLVIATPLALLEQISEVIRGREAGSDCPHMAAASTVVALSETSCHGLDVSAS